ncbi:MAG: lysine 2,3-aminomutase [Peptococcaceae bacterium]|jgi:lysine 2,3-aminomutase|nr:lysine 2,3-aminomutase [Peptococcaceae bacterium]MDH7525209.1 lysine 2,3-aminomutase [Peptococcaceae bacterium]
MLVHNQEMAMINSSLSNSWDDWRWQMKNRIKTAEQLKDYINLTQDEIRGINACLQKFRMAVTPYYASLMDPHDPHCPVRRQAVPSAHELISYKCDLDDPLSEDRDSPVPGLTHRYPDRALLLVTDRCSMYCRHCTRRRLAGQKDTPLPPEQVEMALEYIRKTPAIRDVIISGGDPLTLSDSRIEYLLKELRSIPHVEIIRIGTRTPVVMPQRITPQLCQVIQKYHPVWVNTHFNHPKEITPESARACEMLANHGIPVGNQTVLLRGVNDCPQVMKELMRALLRIRVRPYYIYQCDLSRGTGHFRTPVSKGIEIIENLRGHTSGLAVPHFVIDAPGGGGKIPVIPQYLISQSDRQVVLRNYEGKVFVYAEPENYKSQCKCPSCQEAKPKEHVDIKGLPA